MFKSILKGTLSILLLTSLSFGLASCQNKPTNSTATESTKINSKGKKVTDMPYQISANYGSRSGIYTGIIVNNIPNGTGAFKSKNTTGTEWTYNGSWVDGKMSGHGITVWDDGSKYEGEYSDNEPSGQGKIYTEDGKLLYEGNWENGNYNGNGKLYDSFGSIKFEGEFKNGLPQLPIKNQNDIVTFAEWDYCVRKVDTLNTIDSKTAKGKFVIAFLEITNKAKTEREFGSDLIVIDDQGRTYQMDTEASLDYHHTFKTEAWYLDRIGPSFSSNIPIVFDVAKDSTNIKMLPSKGVETTNPILLLESIPPQ